MATKDSTPQCMPLPNNQKNKLTETQTDSLPIAWHSMPVRNSLQHATSNQQNSHNATSQRNPNRRVVTAQTLRVRQKKLDTETLQIKVVIYTRNFINFALINGFVEFAKDTLTLNEGLDQQIIEAAWQLMVTQKYEEWICIPWNAQLTQECKEKKLQIALNQMSTRFSRRFWENLNTRNRLEEYKKSREIKIAEIEGPLERLQLRRELPVP
ncbi:hypothetical protein B0J14DRAFT_557823 [Halenospora varia]|nr:hypothetical protein B0J14DRAFT_557823 [Halenospora varia]